MRSGLYWTQGCVGFYRLWGFEGIGLLICRSSSWTCLAASVLTRKLRTQSYIAGVLGGLAATLTCQIAGENEHTMTDNANWGFGCVPIAPTLTP